jgi:ABC-type Zn2+ transport system substrate-binding protein/surface adhesin
MQRSTIRRLVATGVAGLAALALSAGPLSADDDDHDHDHDHSHDHSHDHGGAASAQPMLTG